MSEAAIFCPSKVDLKVFMKLMGGWGDCSIRDDEFNASSLGLPSDWGGFWITYFGIVNVEKEASGPVEPSKPVMHKYYVKSVGPFGCDIAVMVFPEKDALVDNSRGIVLPIRDIWWRIARAKPWQEIIGEKRR
ncbi:MAG: hypothetical protein IT535_10135 [Bauldia sp.]|nr:hypothetical protein [Bauldia sp.]